MGSAKGWAASLLFHPSLQKQLKSFISRKDTFSLGVCNGCQLMSLLGLIGNEDGTIIASLKEHVYKIIKYN